MCDIKAEVLPDVSRDIMSDDIRYIDDDTFRNARDWVIYRDYMNAIQFADIIFEQYKILQMKSNEN